MTIASESKLTPIEQWRFYVETENLTRRFLKSLRSQIHSAPVESPAWTAALEAMRHPPPASRLGSKFGEAWRLCLQLREVLELLKTRETL